jgi:hypothetical protein
MSYDHIPFAFIIFGMGLAAAYLRAECRLRVQENP